MNPIIRYGRWIIVGTVVAGLAVVIPTALSREVVSGVGNQEAIVPTPISSASQYLPLNSLANAIGDQGQRGLFTNTYSNQYVDARAGRVLVYVTNLVQGRAMLKAALRANPGIDVDRARLVRAAYSLKRLDQALRRLLAAAAPAGHGLSISGAAPAQNGSGLQVIVQLAGSPPASLAAIRARLAAADGGVPVTVSVAAPLQTSQPG